MFCDILHDTIKQALNEKIPEKDQLKAKNVDDEVKVTKMVIILIKSKAQKLSQLSWREKMKKRDYKDLYWYANLRLMP